MESFFAMSDVDILDPASSQVPLQEIVSVEKAQPNEAYVYEKSRIFQTPIIWTPDRMVRSILRLTQPDINLFKDVLSNEECQLIIQQARPRLSPSLVIHDTTAGSVASDRRRSKNCFFGLAENPLISKIDERLSFLMRMPIEHGEGLQVVHYNVGDEYKPHYDYFVPDTPSHGKLIGKAGQRVATLLIYLNGVIQGGETIFPNLGLSIVPQTGGGVYFSYYNSLGQVDQKTLHGGAPVLAGEKWILTKWMHERPYV